MAAVTVFWNSAFTFFFKLATASKFGTRMDTLADSDSSLDASAAHCSFIVVDDWDFSKLEHNTGHLYWRAILPYEV